MEIPTSDIGTLLLWATLAFSFSALLVVGWYLVVRPTLDFGTKLILFLGIFVFPILAAASGNIAGYETTKKRQFCGGCHVMTPYTEDAENMQSSSLAAVHARNRFFGSKNCYVCHRDYGMFGTITTKVDGLIHAFHYYTAYSNTPIEEALGRIELYRPFRNKNCTQCHSTRTQIFSQLPDHSGLMDEIRVGSASCVTEGCHGPAHPFAKTELP